MVRKMQDLSKVVDQEQQTRDLQKVVLVIGHKGFIGSFLVPILEQKFEVRGYDLVDGQDARDYHTLSTAMEDVNCVLHLASIPMYDESIQPVKYITEGFLPAVTAFDAFLNSQAKHFVFISSGALYGFGPGRPLEGWVKPPIKERLPDKPEEWALLDPYSGVKVAIERYLSTVCSATRRRVSVTSLRLNCIEPHHTGAKDGGAHWGWWCSQKLAAEAVVAALTRKTNGYLAVNVGEENEHLDTRELKALLNGKK